MIIKTFFVVLVIVATINCQNLRPKRQGVKGGRVQQQPEYEQPQAPARRPGAAVQAPVRARLPQAQEEEPQINVAGGEAAPEPPIYGGVMGTPGVDFPGYAQIPKTSFKCSDVPYEPGMYADEETQCQAYHVCFQGRKESFLCGVGTVFNQAILSCDYWHSVDCASSSKFYSVNEELGKGAPEPGPGQAAVRPAVQTRPAAPRPAAPRPRPASAAAAAARPQLDDQQPDEEVGPAPPAPAPRPAAPRPRPSKTGPRPAAPRPAPVAPRPAPLPVQRPAARPAKTAPRPAQRPIVQTQEDEGQTNPEYETY